MATMVATRTAAASKAWPAGVPRPVQNCDGTWRAPLYIPDEERWIMTEWAPDGNVLEVIGTRAWCGDPECTAMHQEDLSKKRLAELRKTRPELFRQAARRAA